MIRIQPLHALAGLVVLLTAACATTEVVKSAPSAPVAETLPAPAKPDPSLFPTTMSVCPGMTVANRPAADTNLVITGFAPFVVAEGKVTLATAPVQDGCFSSGFGPRSFSIHKGVDYYNSDPTDIYAAADGFVREATYRDDFGNMLVIDHGYGVFTRYAHLQAFAPGMTKGAPVKAGSVIGLMGNTSKYNVARHLHYEVLTGEWGAQAGSFALTAVDVMTLPAAKAKS